MRPTQASPKSRLFPVHAALLVACLATPVVLPLAIAQDPRASQTDSTCTVDLSQAGQMADIVSNALNRGLGQDETEVRAFLQGAHQAYPNGKALMKATSERFKIPMADLATEVERYRHCNCSHAGGELAGRARGGDAGEPFELTAFASDVTLHVVLHEMGHALVREFDLPVLGNEETLADAFATHYLTTYLPDRALDVLSARTRSLMIEAGEVPRQEWTVGGEHNSDARRAYQIAALAVAADPEKYRGVAEAIGMGEDQMRGAADYGAEIHRSWRRILAPLWMPEGTLSNEARISYGTDGDFVGKVRTSGLGEVLLDAIQRFDWHSQVKILFEGGEGGAGWSRSKRTITVHGDYVRRFVAQGKRSAQPDER